ncbi:MAG TPA: hypothetical protein VHV83_09255, partial [Armatimonadota bacterium]|nr:hypothetical protein [Armatimonadota bacterium]
TLDALLASAKEQLGDASSISQEQFGRLQALTGSAFLALGNDLFADETAMREKLADHVSAFFAGREFDPLAARAISGGYEDVGDIARFGNVTAEAYRDGQIDAAERDRRLAKIADVAALFDCCKAIAATIDFFTVETPAQKVWQSLAEFFAESVNDHFYEYRPWAYSRGIGFAHIKGDDLYALAVAHHQWQYRFLRNIALAFTELKDMEPALIAELLGDMDTADANPPIGADADSANERRWRAYCQLREIAFMRNDGFPLPQVFPAFDQDIIAAEKRTNMAFVYPIGRTHVSRALMEGPTLAAQLAGEGRPGINLLITRDVQIVDLPQYTRPVLQARNGHLYISREEFITAVKQHRGLSQAEAETLADSCIGPKGVRIAARFTNPVTLGQIFPFHGHPKYTSGRFEELGLPYSSQSLFHTWTTYDKAKYPAIFTPETGVDIPGEIDWLASYSAEMSEEEVRHALEFGDATRNFLGLRAFCERFPLVMAKDAAESGGRGQKAFSLRRNDNSINDEAIADAVEFIYQISLKHKVAVQEVIISSPEYWATEEFMQSFVDRQVQEWGAVVNRTKRPRTKVYGSHRLIFSSDNPLAGEWHISHPITLNSRQLITNVGRGGTLDLFSKSIIRPEFRELLWKRMQEAGEKCMNALAGYGKISAAQYEAESGRKIGEDATGLSFAVPRYMMLDFLVQPIFAEEGMLVDAAPVYDENGERTGVDFILQRGAERFTATVKDWRVVLIEPNIGIGLWDRLAIREEYYFVRTAKQPDWNTVGANARIVLRDMAKAGEDYLKAVTK